MVHVGEVTACTRGHKGEVHEGYSKIVQLGLIKPSILKQLKDKDYYRLLQSEEIGLQVIKF